MPHLEPIPPQNLPYLGYVAKHRDAINRVAESLGLRPTAIAGVMMEDYRSQFNRRFDYEYNGEDHFLPLPFDQVDRNIDGNTLKFIQQHRGFSSSQEMLEYMYAKHEKAIKAGEKTDRKEKWTAELVTGQVGLYADNPMGLDIGVGNIRFGFAIHLLKEYIAKHPNDDPLHLKQYEQDYAKLFKDMANVDHPASIAMAGLVVKDADRYLQRHPDKEVRDRYRDATPEEQDQYIGIRYRCSPEMTARQMKKPDVREGLRRKGLPDFYTEGSVVHPNVYRHFSDILDGTRDVVMGAMIVHDEPAAERKPLREKVDEALHGLTEGAKGLLRVVGNPLGRQ